MRTLIVTADDYGMHETVNAAVEECLAAGTVQATCVMVNMPAAGDAGSLRERFPRASVGIHWTLTQGRPVLPPTALRSLVDNDGEFHTYAEFRRRWRSGQIRDDEMYAELRAQHERFRSWAGTPDFWNTHRNIHVFPRLFAAFVRLGEELQIPAMRSHRRITVPVNASPWSYQLRHPVYFMKGQVIARWCRTAEARGVRMPSGVLDMPGAAPGKAEIEVAVERLPWSRIRKPPELLVHPATSADALVFGRLTTSRVREYEVFRDPGLARRLSDRGVMLIGFNAI